MMQMIARSCRLRRRPIRAASRKIRGERGGAVVELAIVMALLMPPMLLGTIEFGGLAYNYIEVCNAAHAGAAYAAQYYIQNYSNGTSTLPSQQNVTTAATNDSPELQNVLASGSAFTVTVATGCGTGAAATGTAVPTCSSPQLPYVRVQVTAQVLPLVRLPGFKGPFTLNNTAIMNLVD